MKDIAPGHQERQDCGNDDIWRGNDLAVRIHQKLDWEIGRVLSSQLLSMMATDGSPVRKYVGIFSAGIAKISAKLGSQISTSSNATGPSSR